MFCLHRKTDYALIALAFLAQRAGEVTSAREIAGAYSLPLPLLMKLLKRMHRMGMLRSVRGSNGGYMIARSLDAVSLYELIVTVEGRDPGSRMRRGVGTSPLEAPIGALHDKLRQFLRDINLSDLIVPGRRIDVPLDLLQLKPHRLKTDAVAPGAVVVK